MKLTRVVFFGFLIVFLLAGCHLSFAKVAGGTLQADQNAGTILEYLTHSSHQVDELEINLRIISIAVTFFFSFLLLINNWSQSSGRLLITLLLIPIINDTSFIIDYYFGISNSARAGINILIFTYPFLFLLFVQTIFIDGFKLHRRHLLTYAAFIAVDFILINTIIYIGQVREQQLFDILYRLLIVILFSLTILIEAFCVFKIIKDWGADLIEKRRRFRLITLLILIIYDLNWMIGEVLSQFFDLESYYYFQTIAEITVILLLAARLIKTDHAFFETFPIQTNSSKKLINVNTNQPYLNHLKQLMEEKKVFRLENQSIGVLAGELKMQEYKLRQLINQELGYRNFKDFINHYRMEEAKELLKKTEMQILNISMEVGFGSIASFNRIFKKRMNLAPSQYRKEHQIS